MKDEETTTPVTAQTSGITLTLTPSIIRKLSDRSYDRRKSGALEVEALVKSIVSKGQHKAVVNDANGVSEDAISSLINMVVMDLVCSANANKRKGGLFGLAGISLGLGPTEIELYLAKLLQPILKCFDDPESRVRYYACESLYNVAKVARSHILAYFNLLFDGLCKLYADVEVDVKNGAQLLDRLIKDIVTECDTFQVDEFMPLVEKYLRMTNPYIRQLLVSWILALDAVPGIDMLEHLPKYLNGIFNMLSDGNIYIRQAADQALNEFLKELKEDETDRDISSMVPILVGQSLSPQKFNRITAMTWLLEFVRLKGQDLASLYHEILSSVLYCISDSEVEIRKVAQEIDNLLLQTVKSSEDGMELDSLLAVIKQQLESPQSANASLESRKTALKWISMLLDKQAKPMLVHVKVLSSIMLATLSDNSDEIVVLTVEVLARIARNTEGFEQVLSDIVKLFNKDRNLLEKRGTFVVRKLSTLLKPDIVYRILSRVLHEDFTNEFEFLSMFIQTLNLILLTSPELNSLRAALKQSWTEYTEKKCGFEMNNLFISLFQTWCYNPISALSLCLLAEAYCLANEITKNLSKVRITVGLLMEIDKLVELLESPIFISLRLHLIQTGDEFRPYLLKALYGLLMLLPQSDTYQVLKGRLDSASSLHLAISNSIFGDSKNPCNEEMSNKDLISYFRSTQNSLFEFQESKYKNKRLI